MPSIDKLISPDKSNATAVEMMKGVFNPSVTQLSNWLKAINKHYSDRLKKRQVGILEKVDRRLHANTYIAEMYDKSVQEFNKNKVIYSTIK
ncbi:1028_t:CDS:2 [Funneliformis mosseae]|uniref:1028_t:CDS:1 n=1 Tax=Funneliformis mosseae TaxID=27381 RepID=A0A9N9HIE7_FUNMO|nr:1028_t:CDS:2 [Funneliformis mosseae]